LQQLECGIFGRTVVRHCLATPKQLLFVFFPPLSHPHHRAATTGAPYNRPCEVSATQTTRVDGGPAGRPRGVLNPPPPCPHALPRPLRQRKAPHPHRRRGARRRPFTASRAHCSGAGNQSSLILLTSKKWRLQKEGRKSRRHSIEMKSDWLFDKPRSYYWLRVAASNLASQSTCPAGVTQSHCNPQ